MSAWAGTATCSPTRLPRAYRHGSRSGTSTGSSRISSSARAKVCGRRCASRPRGRWAAAREDALPAAAGLEMLHNAFLVHDDIEDGSDSRRGVATMHRRVGVPIAVNTGDAMNALAMRLFRKSGETLGPGDGACASSTKSIICSSRPSEGQAMELGWVRDNDLTVGTDDYLRLVLKKTAWYSFIHPMRIGALVANGDDRNLGRFDRFGYLLGLAFQITDDVLNLNGDVARYGKEINGDLWEGKRTLRAGARGRPRKPRRPNVDQRASWRGRASAACRARCCGCIRFWRGGSIRMGAAGGGRIRGSRGAGIRRRRPSPACRQAPTSIGCALASTSSSGGMRSGQLCALSSVIILCFVSDNPGWKHPFSMDSPPGLERRLEQVAPEGLK